MFSGLPLDQSFWARGLKLRAIFFRDFRERLIIIEKKENNRKIMEKSCETHPETHVSFPATLEVFFIRKTETNRVVFL